ncbi:hypothetical protein MP228_010908 [Amoeboaphelidium protococcarum]|nr:hypothetical protein MP228_010908 [Amoeboaphelidium protococcarum]
MSAHTHPSSPGVNPYNAFVFFYPIVVANVVSTPISPQQSSDNLDQPQQQQYTFQVPLMPFMNFGVPPGSWEQILLNNVMTQSMEESKKKIVASPSAVSALHVVDSDQISASTSSSDCPICTDALKSSTAVALPCGHIYHQSCVSQWLLNHSNQCCMCRYELDTEDSQYNDEAHKRNQVNRCGLLHNHLCWCDVGSSDPLIKLGCGHQFHQQCIDGMMRLQGSEASRQIKCPNCMKFHTFSDDHQQI